MGEDAASLFAELGLSAVALAFLLFVALLLSSYVKIVTVLGMVRLGFGIGSLPATFVTGGLALALSFFVMYPQLRESGAAMDNVLKSRSPVTDRDRAQAVNAGIAEWKKFVETHSQRTEVERFQGIAKRLDDKFRASRGEANVAQPPVEANSWRVLAPAFVISELREAFQTGLSIFLPFLVVDLLVAVALTGVGMDRLNPALISFPFKVLLFVTLDGWGLITSNLVSTYG